MHLLLDMTHLAAPLDELATGIRATLAEVLARGPGATPS
jgi:hypothetical protein